MTTTVEPSQDLDSWSGALDLIVVDVRLEAEDVISVQLSDPGGRDLPAWEPGAHLELELPSGLRRQYSLCGDPADRSSYKVAVLREANGRGGSRELHDSGLVGRHLQVSTPRNFFALLPSERYLFIAGGIGITPILTMARAVALRHTAEWSLHYGGRAASSMAFVDELNALGAERVAVTPETDSGLLDLDAIIGGADASTAIYCCGPAGLLEAVQLAHERLAPDASLYVERFTASTSQPKPAPLDGERAFDVELRRSGATLHIEPDQNLLDAIREVVPSTPFSCTEGYCGSCEVAVLDGTPDHRDEILTIEEQEAGRSMFPCVSRSRTERLVLDI